MKQEPPFRSSSRTPLYVPPWWERRWPWLLNFLIKLDPEPLLGAFGRLFRPATHVIQVACVPLAEALERVASVFARLWASVASAQDGLVVALPLPGRLRSWLWLGPVKLDDEVESAQVMLRNRQRGFAQVGLVLAALIHAAAFAFWPAMQVQDFSTTSAELAAIDIPPEIVVPPPPEAITRPATPVIAPTDVAEDLTIAPTTFEDNPVRDLPPPPADEEVVVERQPTFTPFTVAPRILNAEEVRERMIEEYPPLLRSAGVGGQVIMWFFVDEKGGIIELRIAQGSGHESLDEAAFRVAEGIRFSPALNRDEYVSVWVQFPITFEVR